MSKLLDPPAQDTHTEAGMWGETFIVVVFFARGHEGLITTGNARMGYGLAVMQLDVPELEDGNVRETSGTLYCHAQPGKRGPLEKGGRETEDKLLYRDRF